MMTKKDDRTNAQILLEAYELVGIVIDRYLDKSAQFDEEASNAHGAHVRTAWECKAEVESNKTNPFSDIREAILKELVFELDDGAGRVSWVEHTKEAV